MMYVMIRQEQRHEERCRQRRKRNFVMPVSRNGLNTGDALLQLRVLRYSQAYEP